MNTPHLTDLSVKEEALFVLDGVYMKAEILSC